MPRFVILEHRTPPGHPRSAHFDLMLEQDGVLRTWACDELPAAGQTTSAEQLPDHRLDYLELEGEISGGRGSVRRVAAGEYVLMQGTGSELRCRLSSKEVSGELTLARDPQAPQRWWVSLDTGDSPSA